jgi:hypothetical protein
MLNVRSRDRLMSQIVAECRGVTHYNERPLTNTAIPGSATTGYSALYPSETFGRSLPASRTDVGWRLPYGEPAVIPCN